jgi:hypothetical protein
MGNGKAVILILLFLLINASCNNENKSKLEEKDIPNIPKCPVNIIEYSTYSQTQTDSFRLRFHNEFRLSIDLLKKKLANIDIGDSLKTEILKLDATNSSANIEYDKDFFATYTLLANDICATHKLFYDKNLPEAMRQEFGKQLVDKVREFSDFRTGKVRRDTVTVIEKVTDTVTVTVVEKIKDTVFIEPKIKVVNPKFIGTFYFAGVYASTSLAKAKQHLTIIRRKKYGNSNVAWNRSNQMYQVYVGPYTQKQNAINAKVKVKNNTSYRSAYVFKAKRYEQGIIEWAY